MLAGMLARFVNAAPFMAVPFMIVPFMVVPVIVPLVMAVPVIVPLVIVVGIVIGAVMVALDIVVDVPACEVMLVFPPIANAWPAIVSAAIAVTAKSVAFFIL
ncbi:MAG: hypothetical protein PHD54_10495 [Desulfuromonadaceae bacterium]|nr:hypothetical protein [Desulfuromonadaceae bacterium]